MRACGEREGYLLESHEIMGIIFVARDLSQHLGVDLRCMLLTDILGGILGGILFLNMFHSFSLYN